MVRGTQASSRTVHVEGSQGLLALSDGCSTSDAHSRGEGRVTLLLCPWWDGVPCLAQEGSLDGS